MPYTPRVHNRLTTALLTALLAALLWASASAPAWASAPGRIVEQAFVADPSGRMTLEEVLRQPQTRYAGTLDRAFDLSVVWVRLRLAPPETAGAQPLPGATAQALRLVPMWFRSLTLYDPLRRDAQGQMAALELPRKSIPFPVSIVTLEAGAEARDLWLRMDPAGPALLKASLLSGRDSTARQVWDSSLLGAAFGMLIMMSIIGMVAWRLDNSGLGRALCVKQMVNLAVALLNFEILSLDALIVDPAWLGVSEWGAELGRVVNYGVSLWFFAKVMTLFQAPTWVLRLLRLVWSLLGLSALLLLVGQVAEFRSFFRLLHPATIVALLVGGFSCLPRPRAPSSPWAQARRWAEKAAFGAVLGLAWMGSFAAGFYKLAEPTLVIILTPLPIIGAVAVLLAIGWNRVRQDRELQTGRQRLAELDTQALAFERDERRRQQEFMVMLAHELKAPLSTMGLVLGSPAPSPLMRHHADLALDSMRRVIDHCAQSVELDDPQAAPQPLPCSLAAEFDQRCDDFPQRARIHTEAAVALPPIALDRRLLAVILNNLLDNALRYSPADTPVSVQLAREEGPGGPTQVVRLTNAPLAGPLPDASQLFKKLYRGTAARRFSGSGLGLYLSRALARRMGGELSAQVEVRSISFTLVLPETPAGAARAPSLSA